jgi:hypothetical protein
MAFTFLLERIRLKAAVTRSLVAPPHVRVGGRRRRHHIHGSRLPAPFNAGDIAFERYVIQFMLGLVSWHLLRRIALAASSF